jgi:hypothetical protein
MAAKQSLLKEKRSLVILLFSLICFTLIIADLCTRFNDTIHAESRHMVTIAIPVEGGANNAEPEKELTPEELDRLIEENMSGEAGG